MIRRTKVVLQLFPLGWGSAILVAEILMHSLLVNQARTGQGIGILEHVGWASNLVAQLRAPRDGLFPAKFRS